MYSSFLLYNIIWIFGFGGFSTGFHGDHHKAYQVKKEFVVEKSIQELHAFYLDLEAFAGKHPLITDVTCLTDYQYCYKYKVDEKPFSWIPYHTTYMAEIANPVYMSQVSYILTEIPMLSPTIDYYFQRIGDDETRIIVEIQVEGNWFLRRILGNKIMRSQKRIITAH